jgi:hypothetical protein
MRGRESAICSIRSAVYPCSIMTWWPGTLNIGRLVDELRAKGHLLEPTLTKTTPASSQAYQSICQGEVFDKLHLSRGSSKQGARHQGGDIASMGLKTSGVKPSGICFGPMALRRIAFTGS